jgi:hypothetical protein
VRSQRQRRDTEGSGGGGGGRGQAEREIVRGGEVQVDNEVEREGRERADRVDDVEVVERMEEGGAVGGEVGRDVENDAGLRNERVVELEVLNEFQWGEVFRKIETCMEKDAGEMVQKMPDSCKNEVKEGMKRMMDRVRDIFNTVSDGVLRERLVREESEKKIAGRVARVEEQIKVVATKAKDLSHDSLKAKIIRSEGEMAKKVKASCCTLKLQDIDFRAATDDKREIVRAAVSILKGDVHPEDRPRFDRMMKRTRVVVLGRRTEERRDRGRSYYTVPILLELGSVQEAEEMGEILRRVGYFTNFHWPGEIMPFVNDIRDEMRSSGYSSDTHYIRVRPEVRSGDVQ